MWLVGAQLTLNSIIYADRKSRIDLNKERESVPFTELGTGTTALQDGSPPEPGAVLLGRRSPVLLWLDSWLPGALAGSRECPKGSGEHLSKCRRFSEDSESSGCG